VIKSDTKEKRETKTDKLTLLESRNAELKALLSSLENEKRRLAESNRRLDGERALLEKEVLHMAEETAKAAKETKGVKMAKGTTGMVFEKKIAALEIELKAINKENHKMREEIDAHYEKLRHDQAQTVNAKRFELFGTDDDDFDRAVAIKAKPRLFGVED
jgi:chromosome segregation ATPase